MPFADGAAGAKPRLLYVVTEDWFFCSHFLPMARAALALGCEVAVATRLAAHREIIEREGLRPIAIDWRRDSLHPLTAVSDLSALTDLFRRERPDIVHAIALRPVLLAGIAAMRAEVPALVAAVTGLGYAFVRRDLSARLLQAGVQAALRRILRRPGTVLVVENDDHARDFAGWTTSDRLVRLPGAGVSLDAFRPSALPDRNPVTAMLVARMIAIKGVAETVAATVRLADAGVPIRLRLVGEPDSGHRDAVTADQLRRWAVHPSVEWLGRRADVGALWAEADVAVLPAIGGDGLPKSLLEALACGRPVVTSDTPGCRETVIAGGNGLIVPPGDVDSLAAALRIMAEGPALRRRYGAASRALAERCFGEAAVVSAVTALYRRLLSAGPAFG